MALIATVDKINFYVPVEYMTITIDYKDSVLIDMPLKYENGKYHAVKDGVKITDYGRKAKYFDQVIPGHVIVRFSDTISNNVKTMHNYYARNVHDATMRYLRTMKNKTSFKNAVKITDIGNGTHLKNTMYHKDLYKKDLEYLCSTYNGRVFKAVPLETKTSMAFRISVNTFLRALSIYNTIDSNDLTKELCNCLINIQQNDITLEEF